LPELPKGRGVATWLFLRVPDENGEAHGVVPWSAS
jgi:hypothetical protein